MLAVMAPEPGGPEALQLVDVDAPTPERHRIIIEVHAAALNRADLLQRMGHYPPPRGESQVLGLECAGVVAELGEGVTSVKRGDRVMALLAGGGYAEYVSVHERMAMPIPQGMTFEQAACIPEAFLTASEALFSEGRLQPGEVVLVHGAAGGVGSAVVQLGHWFGAKVVATAGNGDKLAKARELGADILINNKTQDFEQVLAELGVSVNVVIDTVGAAFWEKHARVLAPAGRLIVVGLMGGAKHEVDFGTLLRKRLKLIGLVMRTRDLSDKIVMTQRFISQGLPQFENGSLVPVIDSVLPLKDVRQAHERMQASAHIGKIVLKVRD